jgi:hypothetical protein
VAAVVPVAEAAVVEAAVAAEAAPAVALVVGLAAAPQAAAHRAAVVAAVAAAHRAMITRVARPMALPAQPRITAGAAGAQDRPVADQAVAGDRAVAAVCQGAEYLDAGRAGHASPRRCAYRCAPKGRSSCQPL